jgi:hypothetical protein
MRIEDKIKRLFIENIADPNFRWIALEIQYRFSYKASEYFAYSQGFVFQGMVELYLWIFEEGTTSKTRIYCIKIEVDHVLSHAVQPRTILSITANSVWR